MCANGSSIEPRRKVQSKANLASKQPGSAGLRPAPTSTEKPKKNAEKTQAKADAKISKKQSINQGNLKVSEPKIIQLKNNDEVMRVINKAQKEEWKDLQFLKLGFSQFHAQNEKFIHIYEVNELNEDHLNKIKSLNLESLEISWISLQNKAKNLSQISSLKELILWNNNLTTEEVSELAKNLKYLDYLSLHGNTIGNEGTIAIAKHLPQLTFLILNSCQISEEGADSISQLSNLSSLSLSGNQIGPDGAASISQLSNLSSLNLSNNKIGPDGAASISQLSNLSSLNLNYNQIGPDGAASISQLSNLSSLNLSHNQIGPDGAASISQLSNLSSLELRHNQIGDHGAASISQLSNLSSLYLDNNQIGPDGAASISQLSNLSSLDLSHNQIGDQGAASIAEGLKQIKVLRLWSNAIKNPPEKLFFLPKLKDFILYGNQLQDPPQEIADQGLKAIRNYYEQRKAQGAVNLYESRLLIVGEPGAGKTSLMKKLLNEKHQPQPHGEDSTTGVNVETGWTFPIEKPSDQHYQVNIWDFGGQEIQYATHQFFLSPRALYVLVIDDRKQHTPLDYWFNVIKLLGDGSPVVVVLNERDQCKITNYDHVRYHEFYKDHFAIYQGEVDLGEEDPKRFQVLRSTFEKELLNLPHVGAKLPAKWKPIRLVLMAKAGRNTLPMSNYRKLCANHEITDEGDQNVLLRYLHDLGVLLHFDDSSLADTLFLNPRWVLNAVYAVFQDKTVIENRGRFTKEWLFNHWKEKEYETDDCNKLLELMLRGRFELVYKLNDEQFIAPQLLPEVKPQFDWNDQHNLRFRFQYPFKPHGLISRLIVRCHSMIFEDIVWRKGVILHKNGAKALVEDRVSKRRGDKLIQINVTGPGAACKDLLDDIRSEIRSIHRSFKNLEVIEEVPIPQNPDLAVPYQFLLEQRYAGTTEFPWPDVKGKLSVSMLLEGLEERPTQEGGMSMKDHPNIVLNIDNSSTNTNQMHQTTKVHSQSQASASAQVDFDVTQQLGQLQGTLAELREELEDVGEQDAVDQLTAIETKLERLENLEPEADVKKQARGPMNKLKRLVTDLGDENSNIRKAVSKLSDGARITKDLIGQYQGFAESLNLPL